MTETEKDKLNHHEVVLEKLSTMLGTVVENQTDMRGDVKSIAIAIGDNRLLMERLVNFEVSSKGTTDRLHRRIDDAVERRKEDMKPLQEDNEHLKAKMHKLRFFSLMADNHKTTWAILAILLSLLVSDVRHKIIGQLDAKTIERSK